MHQLQRDIARLLEVQKKERELLELEAEKAALPEELAGAKAAVARAEEDVHRLKGESKALQAKKKDFELESSEKLEAIAKYQKQQFDVKTNVEYQALQKEIVNRQVENSRIEDRILEVMLEIEEHESRIRSSEELVRAKGVELVAEEKKVAEEGAKVAARIAVVGAERDALLPAIDEAVLRKYQRIFKNKKDTAIVTLTDYVCGGCHMHLPPQIAHLVRKGDELVICESCSRILYWAEGLVEKEPKPESAEKEPAAELLAENGPVRELTAKEPATESAAKDQTAAEGGRQEAEAGTLPGKEGA
jgi:uncharacterized protein